MMTREQFIYLVSKTIKDNPEWMEESMSAMQTGLNARLQKEYKKSTDIEVAFASSLDKKKDKELILKGIKASRCFKDTLWQDKMIKKFAK